MIEPLPAYEARCRAWEDKRATIRQLYQRPECQVSPETWMSPDANASVIEQRVLAEIGPYPERVICSQLEPLTGRTLTLIERDAPTTG